MKNRQFLRAVITTAALLFLVGEPMRCLSCAEGGKGLSLADGFVEPPARRELPAAVRTDAINKLHHGGTPNAY